MSYRAHVKTEFLALELREVLQSAPGVLLGVPADAAATLASIRITTVYDLALATLFCNAARVVDAAANPASVVARFGAPPSDLIVPAHAGDALNAALDRDTRDMLLQFRHTVVLEFPFDRFADAALARVAAETQTAVKRDTAAGSPSGPPALAADVEKLLLVQQVQARVRALRATLRAETDAAMRRRLVESYDRATQLRFELDRDMIVKSVAWDGSGISRVTLQLADGAASVLTSSGDRTSPAPKAHPQLGTGLPLDRLRSLHVSLDAAPNTNPSDLDIVRLYVLVQLRDRQVWLDFSFVASRAQASELMLLQAHPPVDVNDMANRLMAAQLHYSQSIWLRADRQSLIMQLTPYECDVAGTKLRVIEWIDPVPVTVAGNYLAFRFTYEADTAWKEWKARETSAARPHVGLVPLPTGGVFAEAVMGEFNSAEKLDATRFWKWQESPIPNLAPEITATQPGLHTRIAAPAVSALPASVLSLQAPLALPALGSSDALLKMLVVSNLFNDMSGADITKGLLKASIEASRDGDIAAAQQADSPPPAPPGIQPLAAGTHTPADAPPVGALAAPTVSIQAPLALPDHVGLKDLLTAITTSNMFRNMSGLASSGDAANQALDASGKAATASLTAAGAALARTLGLLVDTLTSTNTNMSDTGALVNQKAEAAKADAAAKEAPASAGDSARATLLDEVLSAVGIKTAAKPPATPGSQAPSATDPALLDSRLVTEPTFSDVLGFVHLLERVDDADLVAVMTRRFSTLAATANPLQKYAELVDVINKNSAELVNPARFLYAAKFVKTGVLPGDATFNQAEVAAVRSSALDLAVKRALPVASTVNGADTATAALTAILGACAVHGVADVDSVSYVLATAHHESAMRKSTTEVANGLSSDTVFTRDAYFFNEIPGKKPGYNTLAGNTKAGTTLQAAGVINGAPSVTLWNGPVYPDAQPAAVKIAARTCDFMLFIGRGHVKLVGRRAYHQFSNLAALGNVNFEANPERVAEPASAAGILVLGMKLGSFRGNNKLSDYDLASGWDATNARDIIEDDKATYGAAIRDIAKQYKSKLVQLAKLDETRPLI